MAVNHDCIIEAPFLMEVLHTPSPQEQLALQGRPLAGSPGFPGPGKDIISFEETLHISHSVGVAKHPRFAGLAPHRHNFIEMMYVCSGQVIHEIDGKEIRMGPGDILLLNQYTTHSVRPCGEDDIAVNLAIHPRFFDETYELAAKRTIISDFIVDILRGAVHCNQYLFFSSRSHLPIHHLMEILLCTAFPHVDDMSPRNKKSDGDVNRSLMFLVIYYLSNDLTNLDNQGSYSYEQVMMRTVEEYIHSSYQTATLRELAEILNQTESGLSRQIKTIFGATFKELLQAKRFERAILILQETNLAVSDIALAVGYENSSYFYRRFREIYRMSPKEFREQSRAEEAKHN